MCDCARQGLHLMSSRCLPCLPVINFLRSHADTNVSNSLPAWQLKSRSITRVLLPTALPLLLHLCVPAGAMGNYSQGMNMNMPMGYGNMGGMGMGQMGMGGMNAMGGMGGMGGMNNMGGARKQGGVMGLGDQNGNLQVSI